MKKIIIGLILLTTVTCRTSEDTKKRTIEQAHIVEMVLWKSKPGITTETAKKAITKLNHFVTKQPGFVARKTAIAADGKFLDLVYWTDLASAKTASEKAMKNEALIPIFSTIDEKEMLFQHFEIFNRIESLK
ncbi:hypothetical protein [Tenacibaculum amylolyticum]|uniref:hypothetical protein n=1 Tax=Tenacibaculum amylolyticum TaxID=104269 RepID=UPI0038949C4E